MKSRHSTVLARLAALAALAACGGCTMIEHQITKPPPPPPEPLAMPTPEAGAIYSSGGGMSLFEDAKAHNVGDLLTVVLVEKTAAAKSANTATSKADSATLNDVSVFGKKIGVNSGVSGTRAFTGKGDSSQSNSLSGSLTVAVVQRYPNGNLLVRGEKQLELNQGSEFVRIEGTVRPQDIATDNSVTSDRVGNAKVVYTGRGALADNNAQGWLTRFFASPFFPF